ncbi:NAD(P)H-binding protein [Bdellovibrio sp. HCB337]|uniref:NAD(P)H-binding protein n=1 Tax=Bdellovibrio sp. HCB337 TaxID=3394358 RepID=UPI0039A40BB2
MIAVITGASGLVGKSLLQKLFQESGVTQVVSVSRRSLGVQDPKLKEVLVADFADLPSHQKELQGDLYFCCLGTTIKTAGSQENFRKVDYQAVVDFGKIAKANNAKSFVLISAAGAKKDSAIFYNQVKGETEDALRALKLNSLSIFRPGFLLGHRQEVRRGEQMVGAVLKLVSPVLSENIQKTMATDVDGLAVHMLQAGKIASPGITVIESKNI